MCSTTTLPSRSDLLAHGQHGLALRFADAFPAGGHYGRLPALRFSLVRR
jgi:hypothetical protein